MRKLVSVLTSALLAVSAFASVYTANAVNFQVSDISASENLNASASELSGYAEQVAALVNEERAANGLPELKCFPMLDTVASERAEELLDTYSHERPDGSSCFTILDDYGLDYNSAGENIARGYSSPESVVSGWMNSDGHRANILDEGYGYIGVGVSYDGSYYYWTQMFIACDYTPSGVYTPAKTVESTTEASSSANKEIEEITLGSSIDGIVAGDSGNWYEFTAPGSGYYTFETSGSSDTVGYIYSSPSSSLYIDYDDDSGSGYNFSISRFMSSGETIYLYVNGYGSSGIVYTLSVAIEEEPVTEEPTSEPVTDPVIQEGPQEDGSYIFEDDKDSYTIYTAEEIANSPVKPTLSASKITLSESEARGQTVDVSINVSGADGKWCSSGIHLYYDERLSLCYKSNGLVDYSRGEAMSDLICLVDEATSNGVFLTTAGIGDYGTDGNIITYKFTIPDDAAAGDRFDLDLRYVTYDCFTNAADDETGRLMQAYLFTQGLEDGYIEIVSDPTTTTTTTAPSGEPQMIPSSLTMQPGDTNTLLVLNVPDGTTVQWTSNNTKIATVDNGKVTAVGEGTATIYAICGNTLLECTVTVSSGNTVFGDADGDGLLSVNDVVKVMCYAIDTSKYTLSSEALSAADVYQRGDGIDSSDAFSIQKKLVNLIDSLPES